MIMCVKVVPPCGRTTTREPPPRYSARYIGRSRPSRPIASRPVGRNSIVPRPSIESHSPAGDAAEQRVREIGHLGRDAGRGLALTGCRATPSARAAGSSPARAAAAAASSAARSQPAPCRRRRATAAGAACRSTAGRPAAGCSAVAARAPGPAGARPPGAARPGPCRVARWWAGGFAPLQPAPPARAPMHRRSCRKDIAFMAPPRRLSPQNADKQWQGSFRGSPLPGRYRHPRERPCSSRLSCGSFEDRSPVTRRRSSAERGPRPAHSSARSSAPRAAGQYRAARRSSAPGSATPAAKYSAAGGPNQRCSSQPIGYVGHREPLAAHGGRDAARCAEVRVEQRHVAARSPAPSAPPPPRRAARPACGSTA